MGWQACGVYRCVPVGYLLKVVLWVEWAASIKCRRRRRYGTRVSRTLASSATRRLNCERGLVAPFGVQTAAAARRQASADLPNCFATRVSAKPFLHFLICHEFTAREFIQRGLNQSH